LQDTLLAAWQGLDEFEGRASIRTWLYRIATNRCLDALRTALDGLVDEGPADAAIREKLVQQLNALGIATELQEGWVCDVEFACGRAVNIIGRIEGSEQGVFEVIPIGPAFRVLI
jgi:hypothetical protein